MSDNFDLVEAHNRVFRSALRPLERLVALALVNHWSRLSPAPFTGVERLAEWTGLDRKAVMRALKGLATAGAIRILPRPGQSHLYDLAPLMTLGPVPQRDRSSSGTSPLEGPPVVPERDTHQSPRGTRINPSKKSIEGNQSPRAHARGKGALVHKVDQPAEPGVQELKLHYVAESQRHRKVEPQFGKLWPRAMKAFRELVTTHGLEKAKTIVSNALAADPKFNRRINPWQLVEDANTWLGASPAPARRNARPVQVGSVVDDSEARAAADRLAEGAE